jgi:hypothetical protein
VDAGVLAGARLEVAAALLEPKGSGRAAWGGEDGGEPWEVASRTSEPSLSVLDGFWQHSDRTAVARPASSRSVEWMQEHKTGTHPAAMMAGRHSSCSANRWRMVNAQRLASFHAQRCVPYSLCVREREREWERDRQRQRETETERERDRERQRERETERETERERQRDRESERERESESARERESER